MKVSKMKRVIKSTQVNRRNPRATYKSISFRGWKTSKEEMLNAIRKCKQFNYDKQSIDELIKKARPNREQAEGAIQALQEYLNCLNNYLSNPHSSTYVNQLESDLHNQVFKQYDM